MLSMGWISRQDLRLAKILRRNSRIEIKWMRASPAVRSKIGEATLSKLTAEIQRFEGDTNPHLSDPKDRLLAQVTLGMNASQVALDLGCSEESMEFARAFNERLDLLSDLVQRGGPDDEEMKRFQGFSDIARERYAHIHESWQRSTEAR